MFCDSITKHVDHNECDQLEEWICSENNIIILFIIFLYFLELPWYVFVWDNILLAERADNVVHEVFVNLRTVKDKLR